MDNMLHQMEIFHAVGTWNSFSKAATALSVSKSYVSTQITALETKLGFKLLHRTTRHLNLTEEGRLFFESCAKIIGEKKLAISQLRESTTELVGHLKISAPPSMCETLLAELLPKFQKQYPKISLIIDSSSVVKNLLEHDIDIALRMTHNPDEKFIARLITNFKFITCATNAYLKKHGEPQSPADLLNHNCLIYSSDPAKNQWPYQIQEQEKTIQVDGNLTSTNSLIIKKSLLEHQGIARLPQYILMAEIKKETVKILLTEYSNIEIPFYAIYASNITITPKIKHFIQFLKDYFKN